MKKLLKAIAAVCLILWLGAIARCEILTWLHGDEFADAWQQTRMIDGVTTMKVLDCDKWFARVYYKNDAGGHLLLFKRRIPGWEMVSWDTVWAKRGSADDFIWPYIR